MREIKFYNSAYFKFVIIFILLGIIPIMCVSILFYFRFSSNVDELTKSSYQQRNYYIEKNISEILNSANDILEYSYEFSNDDYEYFYEALKDDTNKHYQIRLNAIYQILSDMKNRSNIISSVRFVDEKGQVYVSFANQGKTIKTGSEFYNGVGDLEVSEYRHLFIRPGVFEGDYCINSEDYVFTLARNYMDVSSVRKIRTDILGTFYIDINENAIDEIVSLTEDTDTMTYVVDVENKTLIYSSDENDYSKDTLPMYGISSITGESGMYLSGQKRVCYEQIDDSDCYVCSVINESLVTDKVFRNNINIFVVLIVSTVLVFSLYITISRRMILPITEVVQGMRRVQAGDLDVSVEVYTGDEMEYLAEGFNSMVESLSHYIDQMYMAQIRQREAELDALKMQIQPHYLYNTLDVIRMTAVENNDTKTAGLLLSLSRQLRYLLANQGDIVCLKDELSNIQNYFVITRVRYSNLYSLTIQVPDNLMNLKVPKLILQPIVENAIKHGLRSREGRGSVEISASIIEGNLQIIVMDDGVGIDKDIVAKMNEELSDMSYKFDENSPFGVGMKNVYDRIKYYCGDNYGYEISSYLGMGTIVKFTLPINGEDDNDVESNLS